MTHVVTENCAQCRYTRCVTSCPVSCFHGDDERLYIDPNMCTDCGACIALCPVEAISEEFDLGAEQEHWLAINAERSAVLPVIRQQQSPLEGADARRAELGFG